MFRISQALKMAVLFMCELGIHYTLVLLILFILNL